MRVKDQPLPLDSEENISEIDVSAEMRTSFLEYAVSVIHARALPDARDGLKPVQRRILFQMDQMGLRPDRGHVKSQRVVGEVMGKLHPHGDSAIYDALVRLAQPFNLRVPLVDGHGNFGSLDDGPAAARYTEARLAPAAMDLVAGLDEDTVDFVPNYDNQFMQPEVLPAAFPQLLVNGASGIAVGMATNIAPHNLAETIAAACHLLDHPEADTEELMRYVPGPDLPEGGVIVGLDGVREAYETGRGAFRTRAKVQIERVTARKVGLVVTELPYMVGPEKVIEKIKENVSAGRLKGISSVQNLTDRVHGLRLVIEVKNGFNPEAVLQQLYQRTPLEDSFSINAVALVDGQPRTLGLKEMLRVFLDHRIGVTRRRCEFRLGKFRDRLHLVEGLLIAVLDIDDVIAIIRSSEDVDSARGRLMTAFDLSEVQANHILELRLRRLTKFSRLELESERDDLGARIAGLEEILASTSLLHALVKSEMQEVSARLGTARRTVLLTSTGAEGVAASSAAGVAGTVGAGMPTSALAAAALPAAPRSGKGLDLEIADEPCTVVLSATGALARIQGADPLEPGGTRAAHDGWRAQIASTARSQVAVVTADGVAHRLDVLDLPALPRFETGLSLAAATPARLLLHTDSPAVGLLDPDGDSVVAMGTAQGVVKRLKPDALQRDEWEIIALEAGDRLVGLSVCSQDADLVFVSSDAQLLRTPAAKVRPQGRTAAGMAGMKLSAGAEAIGFWVVEQAEEAVVVTVAAAAGALPGTGQTTVKVTPFELYPVKGRGGQGVRAQRFLRGEDRLDIAWVGPRPSRAASADGSAVELPAEDARRDGSGSPISLPIATLG
ncbi:DNA topoisomerase IV subunit A [Schaalia sp. 19OD2882]|uniref:DNA gyrase/topoisomerase IV subunit A n=1 Tax=Schaalia sp. 19OD2882 TaxID=2794089 RepID=UPI001C1F155B|nr:DNA topoisomerase IV subunit A [Schaalia sp. 19OD2882]QWW18864.1 DNA topoisomerase IV subunit A [Schaalia sp. 19OD2882]